MAHRSGHITLQSFLRKYLFKNGIDEDQIHRYHVILADGLREVAIHHLPITITSVLAVNTTNQTASFPNDFIDYIFIAIELNGRWWVFTRDDTMVDSTLTGINGSDLSGAMVSIGAGSTGGHNPYLFQVDYENNRFLFNGVKSTNTVVLKYNSTGVESVSYGSTNDIEIPVYAEDVLECYLDWKLVSKAGAGIEERKWKKDRYNEALSMMRNIHSSTVSEISDVWLGSSNQTFIR